jgi:hypothetical protein
MMADLASAMERAAAVCRAQPATDAGLPAIQDALLDVVVLLDVTGRVWTGMANVLFVMEQRSLRSELHRRLSEAEERHGVVRHRPGGGDDER